MRFDQDMEKVDFRVENRELYAPSAKEFSTVTVPPMSFLAIDGHGDPNASEHFQAATGALYALSYTAKFHSKKRLGRDYVVGPLEGLWWTPDESAFGAAPRSEWLWTLLVRQADWIPADDWAGIRAAAASKITIDPDAVRLETLDEGLSVQILYRGSYSDEAPTIARMHEWIHTNGYTETGHHHELYLSDPRRTAPASLKTILRQPIRPSAAPVT
jgi:hypothetical protein